jgi:hypothetical protein
LVEFSQLGIQLIGKIVYLGRLPVESKNRPGTALTGADDVVKDLLNGGNI